MPKKLNDFQFSDLLNNINSIDNEIGALKRKRKREIKIAGITKSAFDYRKRVFKPR